MPSNRSALRSATALVAAVALTFGGFAVTAPTASAAPKAPTGLTPTGPVGTATPTFSWAGVSGATSYEVQADNSVDFGSPEFSLSTVNTKAVPTGYLPDGDIVWRVRGVDANGAKGPWSTTSVQISSVAPPTPLSPADGDQLSQPDEPPLLTWGAVPGATAYDVEIDRDGNWIGQTSATTEGTSYLVGAPQEIGTWSWRVRAQRGKGRVTQWSNPMTYEIMPLGTVQADPSMNTGLPITDVAIDWNPVPGAVKYQLQIDTDPDFNTPDEDRIVVSTRFSPPETYLNEQYYWRVRAIDGSGNRMDWPITPFQFQRNWPDTPTLQYPPDATQVGDPFYYQWTPVQWATNYRLEVGTDPSFTPGTYETCITAATTYAPREATDDCGAPISDARYWRVKAVDDSAGVQGIYSDIWTINYQPGNPTQLSPINGISVEIPTFKWTAGREVEKYRLRYWKTSTPGSVTQVDTYALSYTPAGILDPATYAWTIQTIDHDGDISDLFPSKTFTVVAMTPGVSSTPEPTLPDTTQSTRFPNLTWESVAGAEYYEIFIKRDFQSSYEYTGNYLVNTHFQYPAATDREDTHLATGKWDYFVVAYDDAGIELGTGSDGHFEITDLGSVGGWSLALDGNANRLEEGCEQNIVVNVSNQCVGLPATPVLSWAPVEGASYYYVYLANDRELTNLLYPAAGNATRTQNTMWVPPAQLRDNTAGTSYYWYVRPCKTGSKCNPDPVSVDASATNAFRKLSPGINLLAPAQGSQQSDDVRFDWTDYYDTNQAAFYDGGNGSGDEPSYQTAMRYRIQISQSPVFANTVIDISVDQTTFTSFASTLPEGTLYWRVQAVDANGNQLQWSATNSFTKVSGKTTLTSPVGSQVVTGDTPFRWQPKNFAGSYRIEIYANDDANFSPINRVLSKVTKQPSFAPVEFLAPSSTAYRWRVQAIDASNRDTAWSDGGRFFVSTGNLITITPTTTGYIRPRTLYFAWNPVQLAATYRLEVRNTSTNKNHIDVTTVAQAYAPPKALGDGSYEWRVTARDPSGGSLGQSAWKPFKVDATAPIIDNLKPKAFDRGTKLSLAGTFSEKVSGVSTKTVKMYKKGKKTAIRASVTLTKGRKLLIVNKGQLFLRIGQVYVVKMTSGIRDMAGNQLTKTVVTITVVARRQVVARWSR